MVTGHTRVFAGDQNLDAQSDALKAAGSERILADKLNLPVGVDEASIR